MLVTVANGMDNPLIAARGPFDLVIANILAGPLIEFAAIRHDATSREAYIPGVLLALERLPTLPPGLTVGLESLLD